MRLPDSFKNSYSRFSSYPRNLIDTGYYHSTLETYREELEEDAGGLFNDNNRNATTDVPLWDVVLPPTQQVHLRGPDVLEKWHVCDETDLKDFLSDKSTLTATNIVYTGELATRADPKCRYM